MPQRCVFRTRSPLGNISIQIIGFNIFKVTGAGSGIGRELACQLAQENCIVICVDKSSDANEETVEIIRKSGIHNGEKPQAISMVCDMTASESVQALAKNVFNNYGTVNILINNAGIGGFVGSITDTSTEQVNDVINANLMTHFWVSMESLGYC